MLCVVALALTAGFIGKRGPAWVIKLLGGQNQKGDFAVVACGIIIEDADGISGSSGGQMARRRYQNGKIIKVGKIRPRFVLRWRDDVLQEDGTIARPERKTFLGFVDELGTEKMARRKADLVLAPINDLNRVIGRSAFFGEFAQRWVETMLVHQKPSSAQSARIHVRKHLVPAFGQLRMEEVTQERVQRLVTGLRRSRKTAVNVLMTLRGIQRTAKSWGYAVGTWEMRELALPPRPARRTKMFQPEQARAILQVASQPWLALFALVAMTGLRAGEALGLMREDLDFAGGTITVRQSVTRRRISTPKTESSARTVPMPTVLAGLLKDHLAHTWIPNPGALVFCSQAGGPLESQKVVRKYLRPILDRLGLPRLGLHAFRHGMASMMPLVGASPAATQKQLGHADPRVTLGVYSHLVGDEHRRAADRVAELLRPESGQQDGKSLTVQ
jgi:integrase